ncbi:MAG: hypothetical protein FWD38_05935 [Oscillospiraceae bacterium]|nr:hypothetical protein [Oscillospiraceae bacterium]
MENTFMRLAVYDNTEKDRELTVSYISAYFERTDIPVKIHRFYDTNGLIDAFRHDRFTAVFIGMDSMNEVDAAWIIRKFAPGCSLVIMSNSGDYSLEGYRLEAFNYWLKPVGSEKAGETLERLMAHHTVPHTKDFKRNITHLSEHDLEGIAAAGLPPDEQRKKQKELHVNGKLII